METKNNEVRKGYKAYSKGLICRGMQFEVDKEYKTKGSPIACKKGIHYCENPLDVLDYYNLVGSEFTEVEALGDVHTDDNKKFATNKIKIGVKLDLPMFIKASIDFVWEKIKADGGKCEKIQSASGDYSQLAASGDYSQLDITGKNSVGAAIGYGNSIKGIIGSWITLAEYNNDGICICVKSAKIDGKKLLADTWYILKDKKFTVNQ
jgi:hypothetical protein